MGDASSADETDPFAPFARLGDADMRLDRGAALIAGGEDSQRVDACIAKLDALAERARPLVEQHTEGGQRLRALLDFLFEDHGLRGNTQDYYDPRNSFIDDVLEQRRGIPISLAVIYIEVGRRLGVPLSGVGFPGHFLISYPSAPAVFIDPFAPGRLMTTRDCAQILEQQSGGKLQLSPEHVRVATTREILVRMLGNLKMVHAHRDEPQLAIRACNRMLWLLPDATTELRDRGALHYRTGALRSARQDLERYLERAGDDGDAEDAGEVHALLAKIEQGMRALN